MSDSAIERHIDLLGRLFVVAAFLAALVAVAMIVMGLGTATISRPGDTGLEFRAAVMGFTFGLVGLVALLWAGANAAIGMGLRRRRRWSRRVGLALSVLNIFVLPFGTALAVYTVWVLLNHDARLAFAPTCAPAGA
jgi:hypothetical protein